MISRTFDLCVYGGNAAGIAAAYTASEMGLKTVVVEYTNHPGGLSSAGLGHTDQGDFTLLGGVAEKFYRSIAEHYQGDAFKTSRFPGWRGARHEPHVAEEIFLNMIREKNITFIPAHRLNSVEMNGKRIRTAYFDYAPPGKDGVPPAKAQEVKSLKISAKYFIDSSYEGDLLAQAGVSYAVGRESEKTYGESHAGVRLNMPLDIDVYKVPGKPKSGLLPLLQPDDGKKNGEGDDTTQAYNFRLCLTDLKDQVPITPPDNYDPAFYEVFGRWIDLWNRQGRPLLPEQYHEKFNPYFHPRMLKFSPIPNGKVDLNNAEGGTTDMVGFSRDWPEGDWKTRSELWRKHVDYTKGLLYFLRTDKRLLPETRAELARWGLPKDEFRDTGHWPFQLYVREARRMKGSFIMTQEVCQKNTVTDSVGLGSYSLDSHNCRRLAKDGKMVFEGSFWIPPELPYYRISMRCLLPKKSECENLTVPVCMSASHVAYASLRMEPVMMVLGEAAAAIAALAAKKDSPVQSVKYASLRKELVKRNARLDEETLRRPGKTPAKVISILPYRWTKNDISQLWKDCAEMGKAGTTHFAFCSSMEPENMDDLYEKADALRLQFRKLRTGIKGIGKVGYLIQSTLSHGHRAGKLKGFRELIALNGRNTHRFCPLDGNFRKYMGEAVRRLCQEKPDFLLVDDDFRLILSGFGCFCPEHLKRFAAVAGRKYTREELEKILNQTDPESKRIGDLYAKMDMETLWEVAAVIRESIDSVDPEIECGFCTSSEGGEFLYAAKTAKILAGKTKPFVRLNNGFYMEDGLLSFPYRQMNTAIEHHYIAREGADTISECDSYPHNRYSLSLTGLNMHLCSSMLTGCIGRKIWIENFRRNDPEIPALYNGYLKKNWKKYDVLNGVRKEFPWRGAVVPLPERPPTFLNPATSAKMIRIGDFIADCFGVLGIAASYKDDGASIVLLTGDLVGMYSDDEITAYLKRNVILDSSAVTALLKRGFGKEIGILKTKEIPGGVEEKVTDPRMLKAGAPETLPISRSGSVTLFPVKDAEVLSRLSRRRFMGAPLEDSVDVAPATVLYRNDRGGRIVSLSFPMTRETWSRNINLHHIERKRFFLALLDVLDHSRAPAWVETDLSCYLMYGTCAHTNNRFHAAVFNLSLDPMTEVRLHVKRDVKKVSVLQGSGKYVPVKFCKQGDAVTVENPGNEIPLILLGEFE